MFGFSATFPCFGSRVFIPGATAVTDYFEYQTHRIWFPGQWTTYLNQHGDHFLLSFAANSFFFFARSSSNCNCPILRSAALSFELSVPLSIKLISPKVNISQSNSVFTANEVRILSTQPFSIAVVKRTFIFFLLVFLRTIIVL